MGRSHNGLEKGRRDVRVHAHGVKTPIPPTCVPSARPNNVDIRTWGWKPQAVILRAFSTRVHGELVPPKADASLDHEPLMGSCSYS